LEQISEVGFALVFVRQLGANVLLQLAVVDVEHELWHDLLRIRKHLKFFLIILVGT